MTDRSIVLTRRTRGPLPRRTTFAAYYDAYQARQIWSPQTARSVDLASRSFPYAPLPLRDLRATDIETWVKAMYDRGLAPTTIRTRVSAIRAVLYAAVRDGLVATNPAAGVRLPRTTRRTTTTIMPRATDIERLIHGSPPPYNLLYALCAYAGLRLGEARALTWDSIDSAAGTLTVREQLRLTPGGGWEASPPKYGSVRTIPLEEPLLTLLAVGRTSDSHRVLSGRSGAPLHPGSVARAWSAHRAASGLPEGMRLHDLRHWYASHLIATGHSILAVQRRLGHARASTTLDIYAHLLGGQ